MDLLLRHRAINSDQFQWNINLIQKFLKFKIFHLVSTVVAGLLNPRLQSGFWRPVFLSSIPMGVNVIPPVHTARCARGDPLRTPSGGRARPEHPTGHSDGFPNAKQTGFVLEHFHGFISTKHFLL